MGTALITTDKLPEELELEKKQRVLERLRDRLADREEDLTDLRAALERFEARYTMEVGRLYAEQDEIDAQIAEEELKLVPDDEEIKKRVAELRRLAEESAARAKAAEAMASEEWEPSPEARKAYHELARIIHPDLALDNAEKERRHGLMAELNSAYANGDQARLSKMADEMRSSSEMIRSDSIGDRLVRSIRQIAQVRRRFKEIDRELADRKRSELFDLFEQVEAGSKDGRDLLKQMAERAKTHIMKTQRRLEHLKNVNAAQEEHVKETFGMDISDFRDR
jgi:hypothetical protein